MKQLIIAIVLSLGVGVAVGRYLTPPDVQIKEVVKEVVVTKKDEQTHTVKVTLPDGTVKEETTKTTKEVSTDSRTEKKEEVVITSKPQWVVGASYQFTSGQAYGAQVDRRIIGPVFVGVFANTNKDVGVALRLEF